jgi:hypothetical protein
MSEYDADLVLWSREQAELLRRMGAGQRVTDQVDWENIAEEIETLRRSDWRELRRCVQVVLEHLIKLQASPATSPRKCWRRTILEQRRQIRVLLHDSPSLARRVSEAIGEELGSAHELARSDLSEFDQPLSAQIDGLIFTDDQMLGPWLPD